MINFKIYIPIIHTGCILHLVILFFYFGHIVRQMWRGGPAHSWIQLTPCFAHHMTLENAFKDILLLPLITVY